MDLRSANKVTLAGLSVIAFSSISFADEDFDGGYNPYDQSVYTAGSIGDFNGDGVADTADLEAAGLPNLGAVDVVALECAGCYSFEEVDFSDSQYGGLAGFFTFEIEGYDSGQAADGLNVAMNFSVGDGVAFEDLFEAIADTNTGDTTPLLPTEAGNDESSFDDWLDPELFGEDSVVFNWDPIFFRSLGNGEFLFGWNFGIDIEASQEAGEVVYGGVVVESLAEQLEVPLEDLVDTYEEIVEVEAVGAVPAPGAGLLMLLGMAAGRRRRN